MGVVGSATLLTSVANEEIIPAPPAEWDIGYNFYRFELLNDQGCSIIVNGSDPMYLRPGQGFETQKGDEIVRSIKIVEDGVTFNWMGHLG